MTQRTPPKLAAAFLRWFGPQRPALAGDLVERYQSGESRLWYWRQVVAGIAIGAWRDSHERIWVAIGTVSAAVMLVSTADVITASGRSWLLYQVLQPAAWSHPLLARHGLIVLWITDVAPFAAAALFSGWVIGRVKQEGPGLVLLFASVVFLGLLWRWGMVAVRVIFVAVPRQHLSLPYLLLFVAAQIVLPPLLALLAAIRSDRRQPLSVNRT
jgi:hypothetical protein